MTFTTSPIDLSTSVKLFANTTFDDVEVHLSNEGLHVISTDREVSKQLYGIMKDQGSLSVKGLEGNDGVTLVSALKLAGFTGIESANGEIRAKRAQWQAAGRRHGHRLCGRGRSG